jgi:hypothetical protein
VRFRLAVLILTSAASLIATGSTWAYPWPLKPFDSQHPVRANFGDPRTRFWNGLNGEGLVGPGMFQFHNGIDIAAAGGTPVYPVVTGTVKLINWTAVSVRTKGHGTFQYFHIVPAVDDGQRVIARRTVLGYVMKGYDHVHLAEIRGGKVRNPLAPGGIAPYHDRTVPGVDSISVRRTSSLDPLDPAHVCGSVSLVAAAHDTQSLPVSGAFAGFPVAPALILWSLTRVGGEVYVPEVPAADFRGTLPSTRSFWNVYARGSYQNAPRFSGRQYFMAGRFVYNLASFLDTRWYPNGEYEVKVRVSDTRDNESEGNQRFTIANAAGDPDGCEPGQAPSSSP